MIDFLSEWIEQITISVILITIIELIIPKGNFKKYINVFLGIYVIYSIISPFVDSNTLYKLENLSLENYAYNYQSESIEISSEIQLEDMYLTELENNIKSKVQEYGYKTISCSIDADLSASSENYGIHKISIVVTLDSGTTEIEKINEIKIGDETQNSDENSYNEEIKTLKKNLADYYEIDENMIFVDLK